MVVSWEGGRGLRITSKSETLLRETGLVKVSFHKLRFKRENKFTKKDEFNFIQTVIVSPKR